MTKRDFFILLIKIFGLYSIISALFSRLPNTILLLIKSMKSNQYLLIVPVVLINLFLILGLSYLLLIKAEKISDFLQLEKGFDEDKIDFSGLKSIDVIKFTVLIIGGLLLINNIPSFLIHSLNAFKAAVPKGFDQAYDNQNLNNSIFNTSYLINGLNLVVGYVLIVNFKKIANFLNRKIVE